MQKAMAASGGGMGIGPGPGGPGMVNIPPSILNNPNIPNEIIHALQAGRLGSTVFVANVSCLWNFPNSSKYDSNNLAQGYPYPCQGAKC